MTALSLRYRYGRSPSSAAHAGRSAPSRMCKEAAALEIGRGVLLERGSTLRAAGGGEGPAIDLAQPRVPRTSFHDRPRTQLRKRPQAPQPPYPLGHAQDHVPGYPGEELQRPIGWVPAAWHSLPHVTTGESRVSFTLPYYPRASQGRCTAWPSDRKINNIPSTEPVIFGRLGVLGSGRVEQSCPKLVSVMSSKSKDRSEDPRFVFAPRVGRIQAIAGEFLSVDYRLFTSGELHDRKSSIALSRYYLGLTGCLAPNISMQRSNRSVTPVACATAAPLRLVADLSRYASRPHNYD